MSYLAIINMPGYLPDTDGELPEFETARDAWFYLYHERCDIERDSEMATGICSACGESPSDWQDHDSDTGEAEELARMARANVPGVVYLPGGGDDPNMYSFSLELAVD